MRHWTNGVLCCLALASLNSCRGDPPPPFPIGQGDGFGGADFDYKGVVVDDHTPGIPSSTDPNKRYLRPSELKNAWITTQDGAVKLLSWCYGTDEATVKAKMNANQAEAVTP